jgi:hypothetical protein
MPTWLPCIWSSTDVFRLRLMRVTILALQCTTPTATGFEPRLPIHSISSSVDTATSYGLDDR